MNQQNGHQRSLYGRTCTLLCLIFPLYSSSSFAEDGARRTQDPLPPVEKVGTDIVVENNDSILFENAAGELDGTEIRRFAGNALRFRYKGSVAIFDALDGQAFQIRDSDGSARLTVDPTPSGGNLFQVTHGVYPSMNVRSDAGEIAQIAVATGPGFYSSIATTGDSVVRSIGGDIILESADTGTAIRLVTESNERMTILPDGNVGIGMTSPSERLVVDGNIKLNGSIVSDGDICIGNCP